MRRVLLMALALALFAGGSARTVEAQFLGIISSTPHAAGGTPCTAGSINLSLTTGCNLPQYLGGVFP